MQNFNTNHPEICLILIFEKRIWDQFLHLILFMIFQEKCFSCYILLTDQILLSDYLYFSRYWAICVLQLFCYPGCEVITFESKPLFLIKPLLYDQKVKTKNLRAELAFEVKWKAFLLFLEGFQLPKIVLGLRVNL